jgi:hypothetical protein
MDAADLRCIDSSINLPNKTNARIAIATGHAA